MAKASKKNAKSDKSTKAAKIKGTTFNLREFAKTVAEGKDISVADTHEILKEFCETVNSTVVGGTLEPGDKINLPGLGIMHCVTKKARKARNPKTGETFQVAERPAVKFKLTPTLRLWGKPVKAPPAKAAKKAAKKK